MPLTPSEFRVVVKLDSESCRHCSCGCNKPLGPRIDAEHHKINGKEVSEDCYFDSFGDELDKFPIGVGGVSHGG